MTILAAAGGAASGFASLLGGILANKSSAKQAKRQMQFQEAMSSTAYQRAVIDMRAAGLNPMLAFDQGGASTPPGAQAQQSDVVTPAVTSAMQTQRINQELENLEASEHNTQADTNLKWTQNDLNAQLSKKAIADTDFSVASAKSANLALTREEQWESFYKGTKGADRTALEWIRAQIFGGGSSISPLRMNKP